MSEAAPVYTLKSVKTFIGREGHGFNAVLCRDGKPVADVRDDASGGPVDFHWRDYAAPRVEITVLMERSRDEGLVPMTLRVTPEEAQLYTLTETLPPTVYREDDLTIRMDPEGFVNELVTDHQEAARFRRLLKKSLAAVVPEGICTWKAEPTPENVVRLKKQRPDVEVLSGLPLEDAVARAVQVTKALSRGETVVPVTNRPEPSPPVASIAPEAPKRRARKTP